MQGLCLFSSSQHVMFLGYAGSVLGSAEEAKIMEHNVCLQESRVENESQTLLDSCGFGLAFNLRYHPTI